MELTVLVIIIASTVFVVHGCPFLLQPTSLNTSEGSIVNFTTIACSGSVYWTVNNLVYIPTYQSVNVSNYQTTLTNGSIRSDLVITSSPKYNNTEITATVYTPQPTLSNEVILKVQGLLKSVKNLIFNISSKWLSWLPPTTLDGVDILHYIVSVIDTKLNVVNYTTNSTSTNISLNHLNFISCQRYELIVVPVNIVGEGEETSQQYYHIGVPGVKEDVVLVISEYYISTNITYKVTYDCREQTPVNITAKTKDLSQNTDYNYHTIEHVNDTKVSDNGNDTIIGIYLVDNLPSNSHCMGQLIVNTLTGDKASSQEFEFWTFDIKDAIIYTVAGSVCVNVTYVTVTDAKGFNIKAMSYKTLDIYEVNVTHDQANTMYCLSLPVDEYNITIHDWERDYTISTEFRETANVTINDDDVFPPHVDSSTMTVDTSMPTSVFMVTSSPSPTDIISTITDINLTSSNNTVFVAIVIVIVVVIICALILAILFGMVLTMRKRKIKSQNLLDVMFSSLESPQQSTTEPRYVDMLPNQRMQHPEYEDHVDRITWIASTPSSIGQYHNQNNSRPVYQTGALRQNSYQQVEEFSSHSSNIVSEAMTAGIPYLSVATSATSEIVTHSDFVMPFSTPVLRETTSVESPGQHSGKISTKTNPTSSSYVVQSDDNTGAGHYYSEPADITMSDVAGTRSSYVITSTSNPVQRKTSIDSGSGPHSDKVTATNPRYAELEFLATNCAKPKHVDNVIYSKVVPPVPKKKRSRAETHENVVIRPRPIIPPLRLPQIPSSQPDNDNGYSSTFARNTFSSEKTDTELPTDYLTHSHQAENTSSTSSVVLPITNDPLILPPHPSSASSQSNYTSNSTRGMRDNLSCLQYSEDLVPFTVQSICSTTSSIVDITETEDSLFTQPVEENKSLFVSNDFISTSMTVVTNRTAPVLTGPKVTTHATNTQQSIQYLLPLYDTRVSIWYESLSLVLKTFAIQLISNNDNDVVPDYIISYFNERLQEDTHTLKMIKDN